MSFAEFGRHINPKKFTCKECNRQFAFSARLMQIVYALVFLSAVMGITGGYISVRYGYSTIKTVLAITAVLILIGIPIEIYLWRSADYTQIESQSA